MAVTLLRRKIRRYTKSVNQDLLDRALIHGHTLERFSAGEVNKIIKFLNRDVLPDAVDKLEGRLRRIKQYGWDRGPATTKRLREMIAGTNETVRAGIQDAGKTLREDLKGLAVTEAEWQTRALRAATKGMGLGFVSPNVGRLHSILTSRPMQGALLSKWWDGVGKAAQRDITRQLSIGIAQGEPVDTIVRRLVGTRAAAFGDGAFGAIRRNVRATVRTAANHVSTHARGMTAQENIEVIKGEQIVATLDYRTTPMCMAEDGKVYPVGEGWRPPGHHQCRTTVVPVLKSWKELDIDLKEAPPGTRASMDGQVSAKETYGSWLKKQPHHIQNEALGVTRARMFRQGRLNVKQLVDTKGRTLTLKQLRAKSGVFDKDTKFKDALSRTPRIRKVSGPCGF